MGKGHAQAYLQQRRGSPGESIGEYPNWIASSGHSGPAARTISPVPDVPYCGYSHYYSEIAI